MEDKNESEKIMEEMKRIGEGFNKFIESIGEELNKLFYPKEDEWKMKIPYKYGDDYWVILDNGDIESESWDEYETDGERFNAGNVFPTLKAANLENERRKLLTRFKAFRDECNGDWQINWNKNEAKYYLYKSNMTDDILCNDIYFYETFSLFGYFKNEEDAERAIELFGDEIKELFVEKRLENENN